MPVRVAHVARLVLLRPAVPLPAALGHPHVAVALLPLAAEALPRRLVLVLVVVHRRGVLVVDEAAVPAHPLVAHAVGLDRRGREAEQDVQPVGQPSDDLQSVDAQAHGLGRRDGALRELDGRELGHRGALGPTAVHPEPLVGEVRAALLPAVHGQSSLMVVARRVLHALPNLPDNFPENWR